jgi:hypothetical protein
MKEGGMNRVERYDKLQECGSDALTKRGSVRSGGIYAKRHKFYRRR